MTTENIMEKITELMENPEIMNSIEQAESKEDFIQIFEKSDWKITEEEFDNEVIPALKDYFAIGDEFNETQLEMVNGGGFNCQKFVWNGCRWILKNTIGFDLGPYRGR